MIAVSSFRPLNDSPEYAANQLAAKLSWEGAFDRIVYFNEPDDRMATPRTAFTNSEPWPCIEELMYFCAEQDDWCAILNADIIVSPQMRVAAMKLKQQRALAASSWRFTFDPRRGLNTAEVKDNGIDFFAAPPEIWEEAAEVVPERLRIGHCFWDTWTLGFLNHRAGGAFADLTPWRLIFHPVHGGRKNGYEFDTKDIQPPGTPRMGPMRLM